MKPNSIDKILKYWVLMTMTLIALNSAKAQSYNASFGGYAQGTPITTQFAADDLSFATEAADGTLGTASENSIGVSNSPDGNYPTTEYLNVNFNSPADIASFIFDDEGSELGGRGPGTSTYSAYTSTGTLVGSGLLNGTDGTVTVSLNNVALLQFSNGLDGSAADVEGTSWIFDVDAISYTEVPEPATSAMMAAGSLAIVMLARYRSRFHLPGVGRWDRRASRNRA